MPLDYYGIGAAKGEIVGQGLLGAGQIISKGIKRGKEEKEKKEAQNLSKTLSLINIYTKMGDNLTPEDQVKLYTGALLPMLAKAGGLPEGVDVGEVSKFVGSLAVHSKEQMQGLREDNEKVIDLIHDKKWKEADKFLGGMQSEYGKLPGADAFLKHARTLLKEERKAGRTAKTSAEDLLLKGEVVSAKPGGAGAVERGGLLIRPRTPEEKTKIEVDKATGIAEAQRIEKEQTGLSVGDREKLTIQQKNALAKIKKTAETKKEFETFKKGLEKEAEVDLTDTQLLNAFEDADKALREETGFGGSLEDKEMTAEERAQWKIDYVSSNIESIKKVKGGKAGSRKKNNTKPVRVIRNKKTGEILEIYADGTEKRFNAAGSPIARGGVTR